MKKEITKENREKLDRLLLAIEDTENVVPFKLKTVFNFKGRKSPEIARKIIEAVTAKEELILDPFMGSGSFVIASAQAERKIIGIDIDNYTYSAVYALLTAIDKNKLQLLFEELERLVKFEVMSLYETQCCNTKNYISKLFFDPENAEYFSPLEHREFKDGKNIKLVTPCPICNSKDKAFDGFDYSKLQEIGKMDISRFPKNKYMTNSRINITESTGANTYDRIFTNRNKVALLLIQDAILKLTPSKERDVLEHALVSSLSLARIAMYGSSTDILYHVVQNRAQEMNVWELFESKVDAFVAFKEEYSNILQKDPSNGDKYCILEMSYQDYCSKLENKEKFDLVYTDFPYTDQVPYLERNQMYRIWLKTFYDSSKFDLTTKMLSEEIVQSDSPERPDKNLENYYNSLDEMFKSFYYVLKPKSLAIFTLKLGKSKYFNTLIEIINRARKNGFEYAFRIGIDKNDPTLRKQSAYKNTLSNEMVIAFEKLDESDKYWYIGNKNFEFETVKLIYNLVLKQEVNLSSAVKYVKDILRQQHGYLATEFDLLKIQQIIKSNFIIDINSATVRVDCNKLYLDIEDKSDLFTKFYDYVPIIIRRLLEEKGKFVLDDLYFEIANTLCNGDPKTINQFLEDPHHSNSIKRLIDNYCSSTGRVYEKKTYNIPVDEDAVDISMLDGTPFELLIKQMLEAEGYYNVINTGGSGDLGVDLLANKKDESGMEKLYLFQCKRWAANVGSEPMQRLVAERLRRGADVAICVTTSDYTEDGMKISREMDVGAWNGYDVIRMLNLHFPGKYYNGIL